MKQQDALSLIKQGYLYLQKNDLQKAKNLFVRAKKVAPKSFDVWFALGCLYIRLDNPEKSVSALVKALEIMPEHPVAHGQLGVALYHLGRNEEAATHYEIFIKLQPDNVAAYANLAMAYIDLGRRDEAITACLKAIKIDPNFTGAYILLASANSSLGQYEESLKYYSDVLVIEPENETALAGKADTLIKLGRRTEAYMLINNKVDESKLLPDMVMAFSAVSSDMGREKDALRYLEKSLKQKSLNNNQRLQLHFAAGKLYDKLDDFDNAFKQYRSGNELVQKVYDPVADAVFFDTIIDTFTRDNINIIPGNKIDLITPVFVIGMPRSGTSLVERILGSHSKIFPAGELAEVPKIAEKLAAVKGADVKFPDGIIGADIEFLEKLRNQYLEFLKNKSNGCSFAVDKLPHNFLFLGLINVLFPNAKIIHCKRDALDTCLSNYFQYFSSPLEYPYQLENIAEHYNNYQRLMLHWKKVIQLPVFELKYEDMINNQVSVTKKLISFLDIPFEESCLKFNESKNITRTASYDQTSKPVYTRSIGRWRHYEKYIKTLNNKLKI